MGGVVRALWLMDVRASLRVGVAGVGTHAHALRALELSVGVEALSVLYQGQNGRFGVYKLSYAK